MDIIELSIQSGTWVARYVGPHAAEVVSLFGTDTLPTPYLAAYGAPVAELAERNPGATVYVV